jgi:uncharacterized cupin superfamily protein
VVSEARLERTENGGVARGEGWFVINAKDAPWIERDGRGAYCEFEAEVDFPHLGVNIQVLGPREPMAMYHWEADQEDFLVLAGDALLIAEGQERPLRRWDFVHCPAGTDHVIVGAGEGCAVLAVGARGESTGPNWGAYTVSEAALRHGAGVEQETADADVAYARFAKGRTAPYREGRLAGD